MKKLTILIAFLSMAFFSFAQDYLISFSGTGSATNVDSVRVDNLTQGTFLTISGSDILNLKGVVGIEEQKDSHKRISCYPNPAEHESRIDFYAPTTGIARIEITNAAGRNVANSCFATSAGTQTFCIAGLTKGFFLVKVNGEEYAYSIRLISAGSTLKYPQINYMPIGMMNNGDASLKLGDEAAGSTIVMQYNNGDVLKLTGKSGSYQTISMLVPTQGQAVIFPFYPCIDGSGNNYPIVTIGTQTWMASNLRTTAFTTGVSIPNITEPSAWANTTQPAYVLYQNNNPSTTTYGLLYNGFAALSGNLCPNGWHVATDADWTTMEIFLQNHGYNYDGSIDTDNDRFTNNRIAKSMAANNLWDLAADEGAIGRNLSKNNLSGFSAYAGGFRTDYGNFDNLNIYGFWWTSTNISGSTIYRALYFDESDAKRNMTSNKYGYSVRCIYGIKGL